MRLPMLSAFALAALLACDEGITAPMRPAVYVLQAVDGAPPPVRPNMFTTLTVVAETLFVDPGGVGRRRAVYRRDSDGLIAAWESAFTWRQEGTQLSAWLECVGQGIAACTAEPYLRGVMDGDRWIVGHSHWFLAPLVFRRID